MQSGDIYHPLAWSPEEAFLFLQSVPELEASGLVARLPDWWRKRTRPRVQVVIGNSCGSGLGADALLDFQVRLTVQGEPLSDAELADLVAAGAGAGGLSFAEWMRLLSGVRQDLSWVENFGEDHVGLRGSGRLAARGPGRPS